MSPAALLLLACIPPDQGFARARVMQDLMDGVGGPKALARPGDVLLENDRIRAAVLAGRPSPGPGTTGGSLIDLDLQRHGGEWSRGEGNDLMAEVIPTVNLAVAGALTAESVAILADGSDGGPAVVRVTAGSEPFLQLLGALFAYVQAPNLGFVTDYVLEPGVPWVRVRTTATVLGDGVAPRAEGLALGGVVDELPVVEVGLGGGLIFGDFFLQGGSVDVFVPGLGFDEDGDVEAAGAEGRNLMNDPFAMDFIGGTADGVSYGLASLDGPMWVPLFTSSQTAGFASAVAPPCFRQDPDCGEPALQPGDAFTYERIVAVGQGDVGSVWDAVLQARGTPVGAVRGNVVEVGSRAPVSGVDVFVYAPGADRPTSQWRTDVALDDDTPDGSFAGTLPLGAWELLVHDLGRGSGERVSVVVGPDEATEVTLEAPRAGMATFTVVDQDNRPVPCRITVFPENEARPARDPVLGDGFVGGDPAAVLFAPYGHQETLLPAGRWRAVASRGPEYELGEVRFEITGLHPVDVPLQVVHSVDTAGWTSADLHVHAQPSHDSGVTPTDRVITMVAEGVDYFISSDHDFITDYAPVVEELGLERWVSTSPGLEVTTIESGHTIGFPLDVDWFEEAGGAIDWSGLTPGEILEALNDLSPPSEEVARFIAHPRDGILGYFDQFGFDPYGGTPGTPAIDVPLASILSNPQFFIPGNVSWDFDALELLNGKRFDFVRTPTQPELDAFSAQGGEYAEGGVNAEEFVTRTLAEQQALADGTLELAYGVEGQVDDWFTLLNLGYRFTALANSDTHGTTSVESGCPRNWVLTGLDEPGLVHGADVAAAVKAGRVVASYGPFLQLWVANAEEEVGIGDTLSGGGVLSITVEVRTPAWFGVDRVEIYENGTLIRELQSTGNASDLVDVLETFTHTPTADAWYVAIATGGQSLAPLFSPVERADIQLQDIVVDALSPLPTISDLLGAVIPVPRSGPVLPYGLTNPVWVDLAGDGFDAPGLPTWLRRPAEPPAP